MKEVTIYYRPTLCLVLIVASFNIGLGQTFVAPGKNLEVHGVPPIPASLERGVEAYKGMYGLPLAGWDNTNRKILLKGLSSATWVSEIDAPGKTPETSSIYIESKGVYDLYFQPKRKYLAYTRDAEANENFQLYLYEIGTAKNILYQMASPGILNLCGPIKATSLSTALLL